MNNLIFKSPRKKSDFVLYYIYCLKKYSHYRFHSNLLHNKFNQNSPRLIIVLFIILDASFENDSFEYQDSHFQISFE